MIQDEFVPYEISKQLKDIGFEEDCIAFFEPVLDNKLDFENARNWKELVRNNNEGKIITAPLYQQVFNWFLREYKIFIEPTISSNYHTKELYFNYWIINSIDEYHLGSGNFTFFNNKEILSREAFKTYDQARLACITKLIELVKTKQNL